MENDYPKLSKILVVTEHFPSINQPWIDTYLQHLLANSLDFVVYSSNNNIEKYHGKVKELNLLNRLVDFRLNYLEFIFDSCLEFSSAPVQFIKNQIKVVGIYQFLVKTYQLNKISTYLKLFRFRQSCRKFDQVGVVHAHGEVLAFEFVFFALIRNIPLIYSFHGLPPNSVPQLADNKRKTLYGEVSLLLVNTLAAKQQVIALGCPAEKISVLPQGLSLEDFPFVPRQAPEVGSTLHLLTVARFHREKGIAYAMLALCRLLKQGFNVCWDFVGSGPERQRSIAFAKKLGLAGRITFHEALELADIRALYQKCHLFILPSLSNRTPYDWVETQGVVLQEAQASGCIPIATWVGGIPECVHDKEDAILVRDRSSLAICEAVQYLLARPEEWSRYQENGRRNVEDNFSAHVIGRKMAANLKAAIASKRESEKE